MGMGRLKKVFPGGNTSKGFHSFYDYIIEPDATRIFVIKGGPGVGKSTFMRKIGETMLSRGYDVELHCCSSDNGSLDGVMIPAIRVALLDGTAPQSAVPIVKLINAVHRAADTGKYTGNPALDNNVPALHNNLVHQQAYHILLLLESQFFQPACKFIHRFP